MPRCRCRQVMRSIYARYLQFIKSTIECPQCKWLGSGDKMVMGESFEDGADKHCPVCDWRCGFVAWPMSHEFDRSFKIH